MTSRLAGLGAALSMAACLAVPVLHFRGVIDAGSFRLGFALASIGWFVTATLWSATRSGKQR